MKKVLFALLVVSLLTGRLVAQQLHTSNVEKTMMTQSIDKTKMVVITQDAVSMWDLETPGLIWAKPYSEFGMGQPYRTIRYALSPDMKYLMVQSGESATQRPTLINLNDFTSRIFDQVPTMIMADNTMTIGDYKGDSFRWDLEQIKLIEPFKVKDDWYPSPDRRKFIIPGKKLKAYDIFTKKIEPYVAEGPGAAAGHLWATPVPGGYFAELERNEGVIVLYDITGTEKGRFKASQPTLEGIVGASPTQPYIYTLEKNNTWTSSGKNNIYRNYIVCHRIPDGEVMWTLSLNAAAEDIQKVNEQKKAEEEAAAKKKREEREAMLANAKPGYKQFDARFTTLSMPYTMNYNTVQGFELTGDQFMSGFALQSGSVLHGIGKICTCDEMTAYLLMIRNQSGSADRSNFLIATYDLSGKEISVRNIGTTQKDPSGLTLFDFTINGSGCGRNITTKTTHPNGHVENGKLFMSRCGL